MNRIDAKFKELKHRRKKAFIAFITAGDPSLKVTEELVVTLAENGADMVELGVPFSDPMADGPTIQASSHRALNNHATLNKILNAAARIRKRTEIPLVLMMYYNSILSWGEERFVTQAVKAGVDGVIVPDLPPEEAGLLIRAARRSKFATIFFLSPTTAVSRRKKIIKAARGFIYYVSVAGVTGARRTLPADLLSSVKRTRKMTNIPICVGFGISTPEQIKAISKVADGVIVGSAIVQEVHENSGKRNAVQNVGRFVSRLARIL